MTFSFLRILTYVLGLVGTSLLMPLGVAIWKDETAMPSGSNNDVPTRPST